jgi:hypothetical protein
MEVFLPQRRAERDSQRSGPKGEDEGGVDEAMAERQRSEEDRGRIEDGSEGALGLPRIVGRKRSGVATCCGMNSALRTISRLSVP